MGSKRISSSGKHRLCGEARRPALEPLEPRLLLSTYIVTSLADVGMGTLRGAIAQANRHAGPDVVDFDAGLAGEILLTSGQLGIVDDVDVRGPGRDRVTISGGGNSRVFHVASMVAEAEISGLTITGGRAEIGGAIFNDGRATLTNCTVSGNAANDDGGGIYTDHGTLTLINSTVSGNTAGDDGGGIYNDHGTLTLTGCAISGNTARDGGGIVNHVSLTLTGCTVFGNTAHNAGGGLVNFGELTLTSSIVSGNTAGYDDGGGIYNDGTATLTNCTVSSNTAHDDGGGIFSQVALTLTACTLSDNTARGGGGIYSDGTLALSGSSVWGNTAGWGGGISIAGTLTLTNCTVSGNAAERGAGGIYNGGTVTLTNATVVGNRAAEGGGIWSLSLGTTTLNNTVVAANHAVVGGDVLGPVDPASAFNLVGAGHPTSGLIEGVNGNQVGTPLAPLNPMLGFLADNGGPTPTHAILAGSPLLDGGDDALALDPQGSPLMTDQRGWVHPRIEGGCVDIGAFEAAGGVGPAPGGTVTLADLAPQPPAARDTLLTWTLAGNVPVGSTLGLYYDADGAHNGNETWIAQDLPVLGPEGQLVWRSVQAPAGTYQLAAVVTFPDGSEIADRTRDFELVHAGAPTVYVVDSLLDSVAADGVLSFREALEAADANVAVGDAPAGDPIEVDRIRFHPALAGGTITLGGRQLEITDDVVIEGPGAALLTVDAAGGSRAFRVGSTVTEAEIVGVTMTGGTASEGAGLLNSGTLTLTDCTVSGSTAEGWSGEGGGIHNDGTLTLIGCTVSGNAAEQWGGGVHNTGTLAMSDCTVSGNTVGLWSGGGIHNRGTMRLTDCTVSDNTAENSSGGGISNVGTLTLTGSSVGGNTADDDGGGISNGGALTLTECVVSGNAPGGIDSNGRLTLIASTISGNTAGHGGGIQNYGTLALVTSVVSGNTAAWGGGIRNVLVATLTNSTVCGNTANSQAGGIDNYGWLTLINSTVSGNAAHWAGGISNQGTLTLTASTVSDNTAGEGAGGGIQNVYGTVALTGCTVSGNTAGWGGGIDNNDTLTLTNCTISGNQADGDGGGIYTGALWTRLLTLTNCTITDNDADADADGSGAGGGLDTVYGSTRMYNTIVAGNTRSAGAHPDDVAGIVEPGSLHNLIGDPATSGALIQGPHLNIVGADPMLGPLADNGGPTLTHALLAGSPAIDAGSNVAANEAGLTRDQRGYGRFGDGDGDAVPRVDIGAVELILPGDANGDGTVDGADYTAWADNYQPGVPGKTWGQGDFNGDGVVDGADYTAWAGNYGGTVGGGARRSAPAGGSQSSLKRLPSHVPNSSTGTTIKSCTKQAISTRGSHAPSQGAPTSIKIITAGATTRPTEQTSPAFSQRRRPTTLPSGSRAAAAITHSASWSQNKRSHGTSGSSRGACSRPATARCLPAPIATDRDEARPG